MQKTEMVACSDDGTIFVEFTIYHGGADSIRSAVYSSDSRLVMRRVDYDEQFGDSEQVGDVFEVDTDADTITKV